MADATSNITNLIQLSCMQNNTPTSALSMTDTTPIDAEGIQNYNNSQSSSPSASIVDDDLAAFAKYSM